MKRISTRRGRAGWHNKTVLALWHRHDYRSLAADLEVTPHLLTVYIDLKEGTS